MAPGTNPRSVYVRVLDHLCLQKYGGAMEVLFSYDFAVEGENKDLSSTRSPASIRMSSVTGAVVVGASVRVTGAGVGVNGASVGVTGTGVGSGVGGGGQLKLVLPLSR